MAVGVIASGSSRQWRIAGRPDSTGVGSAALLGLRRRLRWFEELESYRPALRRLPVDRSRLIVLPGADTGTRVLVPIARGRVLPRVEIRTDDTGWPAHVDDVCYRIRVAELRAEAAFPVEALTLTLIVGRWLREREPESPGQVFDLDNLGPSAVVDRLRRHDAAAAAL